MNLNYAVRTTSSLGIDSLNSSQMEIGTVGRNVLPHDVRFLKTKVILKGFYKGSEEGNRIKAEVAVQRILSVIAPDMATPIDKYGKDMVVLRKIKGIHSSRSRLSGTLERDYGRMLVLDTLVGMRDRHYGNWMISDKGRNLHPIDHESCLQGAHLLTSGYGNQFYRMETLSPLERKGALMMLASIRENARSVARWMRAGAEIKGQKLSEDDVVKWVEKAEACRELQ